MEIGGVGKGANGLGEYWVPGHVKDHLRRLSFILPLAAQADWVIDMGAEGGNAGGEAVFAGTPTKLMECAASKTGGYLREIAETA